MDASRIKPPLGPDNAWWWEMADEGKLGIQQCTACNTLRHPPRPMCDACNSMDWRAVEASGRGTICSFTVIRHPQVPGYEYPLVIVLVDLEEGTRVTSELRDCDPGAVEFGMPVRARIHTDADGFRIPVFVPAGSES